MSKHGRVPTCDKCFNKDPIARIECDECFRKCVCGRKFGRNKNEAKRFENHLKQYKKRSAGKRSYTSEVRDDSNPRPTKISKHSLTDTIDKLKNSCCINRCLTRYWPVDELDKTITQMLGLSEKQKSKNIKSTLIQCKVEKLESNAVIKNQHFQLKWKGKSVCVHAFRTIMTVSHGKLCNIVDSLDSNEEEEEEEDPVTEDDTLSTEKETKKNLIVEFLNHLKDNYAEPVVGINGAFQLTQLYDKAMVYELFLYGTTSHDPGDGFTKKIAEQNFKDPPSSSYFCHLWKKYFPLLITESERPQCTDCCEFDRKIGNAIGQQKIDLKIQKNIHLVHQRAMKNVSELAKQRASCYPSIVSSVVIDNMKSKYLPKYRRETTTDWSKTRLLLHIGGMYDDNSDEKTYYLYSNEFSESANTIITQLHLYLKNLINYEEIWITFDNHSTQKNYIILAYFEWLLSFPNFLKNQRAIHLVYLVAGHTHNRLDRANSIVSKKYFSKTVIETPDSMVSSINEIKRFRATIQYPMWDFSSFFKPFLNKYVKQNFQIKKVHHIMLTPEGMSTKAFNEEEWSLWRTNNRIKEPVKILNSIPQGVPVKQQPKPFTQVEELSTTFGVDLWKQVTTQLHQGTVTFDNWPDTCLANEPVESNPIVQENNSFVTEIDVQVQPSMLNEEPQRQYKCKVCRQPKKGHICPGNGVINS